MRLRIALLLLSISVCGTLFAQITSATGNTRGVAKDAGSFRSNFGVIETDGQPATVQLTVYYGYILGADRAAIGDIHGMTVEFQVTGGTGRVIPLITSVDNATGDSIVRLP